MHECIHIQVRTHTHTPHAFMHACIHAQSHAHSHASKHHQLYIYAHTHYAYACLHASTRIDMYTFTNKQCMHVCIHARVHDYVYARTRYVYDVSVLSCKHIHAYVQVFPQLSGACARCLSCLLRAGTTFTAAGNSLSRAFSGHTYSSRRRTCTYAHTTHTYRQQHTHIHIHCTCACIHACMLTGWSARGHRSIRTHLCARKCTYFLTYVRTHITCKALFSDNRCGAR